MRTPWFPWFNSVSNGPEPTQAHWLEFLYLVIPSGFVTEHDRPIPGSRVARLNTSPFSASAIAIDRLSERRQRDRAPRVQ